MADKIAKVQQETFNPFTPEFRKVPLISLVANQVLSDILSTFEEQTMNLCALFVGPRGCGKTALLTYLGNEASRLGWVVANVSPLRACSKILSSAPRSRPRISSRPRPRNASRA